MREIEFALSPAEAADEKNIVAAITAQSGISNLSGWQWRILRKSMDARSKFIKILFRVGIYQDQEIDSMQVPLFESKNVSNASAVHIIGAGPAGLFCALQCIELGLKPVLFERGKNVRERRRDLAKLNKEGILNEESNYCFGEGGAGTYSDGKLYTRSNKRGNISKVLHWFHHFGADQSICYEAHPHIGTNKLPQIIENMRKAIIECGGEIHFDSKLIDVDTQFGRIQKILIQQLGWVNIQQLILATGHSAHDIYELLDRKNILIEAKPFALGVRIEHPQSIIDQLQYRCEIRDPFLPPASYSLVEQINGRGVFSFCMCPGGIIAPASTRQGALVVNGWSPSKRNNPFANSGMVVGIDEKDFKDPHPLAGLKYQYAVEKKAFEAGGGKFVAPAQRMTDFLMNKQSSSLPACSYIPGLQSVSLSEVLPKIVNDALVLGLKHFGQKLQGKFGRPGYLTHEAVLVATESRTSSPVRVPRHQDELTHPQITNLYPCAEGAGYAGGIVSAAMDGMRIAEKIYAKLHPFGH